MLILFAGVAVLALVILGALGYAHARRVVDQVITVQNDAAAARVVRRIGDRFAIASSDALRLASRDKTQQLYTAAVSGDSSLIRPRARFAGDELAARKHGYACQAIQLRDLRGRPLYHLAVAADPDGSGPTDRPTWVRAAWY